MPVTRRLSSLTAEGRGGSSFPTEPPIQKKQSQTRIRGSRCTKPDPWALAIHGSHLARVSARPRLIRRDGCSLHPWRPQRQGNQGKLIRWISPGHSPTHSHSAIMRKTSTPFVSRDSLGRERGVNPRTFPSLGRFYLFYLGLGHAHSGMVRGGAKRARNFPARILVAHLERHPKKEEWAKAHSFFRGRR